MAIDINIGSKLDGKGFKQADTAITKLNKNTKNLARNFGLAFGTAAVLAYGRASVRAFVADDKAATALGTTLKNLNLAYGSNIGTVNGFISRLELQTGVLDDELRPAMDRLLRATGDVTKSQELLGLALDIAAGTGKSVTQVSQSLQKAYLGQNQALGRLGVGLTKAELTSSSFEEIQQRLSTLFAGQATAAADTYAGSLARLTIAGNNAKETIGKGLVDALKTASNSTSTEDLIKKIDRAAESIANFVRETGEFIRITKSIFKFELFLTDPNAFKGMGNVSTSKSSQDTQRADAIAKKNAAALAKLTGVQASNQAKILKDKKLQAAIDKANLALGKGTEIFDMDKIQIAAALTNQAEQLGKATSGAQVLQIANDIARLNVKKSILALEDAIASKDEAAIIAATNKLNADLKILGTLGQQNVKLLDIKSIFDTLIPKDLINLANLNEALRLLGLINLASTGSSTTPAGVGTTAAGTSVLTVAQTPAETNANVSILGEVVSVIADNGKEFIKLVDGLAPVFQTVEDSGAFNALVNSFAGGAIGSFGAGSARMGEGGSLFNSGAVGSRDINITIQTGIGDPNAIAEAIDQVLTDAVQRGSLRGYQAV
jgi:hypothetical protein